MKERAAIVRGDTEIQRPQKKKKKKKLWIVKYFHKNANEMLSIGYFTKAI